MHVFYLHGFVSSPQSTKAAWLAERLRPYGLSLHCPDFNAPDFATLTTTRMIAQVEEAIRRLPPGPVTLIGSSLGGFVAWHAAARRHGGPSRTAQPIDRLVLLAPALILAPIAGWATWTRRVWPAGASRGTPTSSITPSVSAAASGTILAPIAYADAAQYDSFAVAAGRRRSADAGLPGPGR